MFYHLFYPLRDYFFVFNVFKYITFRAAYAAVTALLICFIFGPMLIRMFTLFQIGQVIREEGPETHLKKQGTPTMGGILIILATVLPTLLWADVTNSYIILTVVTMLFLGMIGFMDDYLKVIKKHPKGLVARYKLIGQIVMGGLLGVYLYLNPHYVVELASGVTEHASILTFPFFKEHFIPLGLLFIPFVILVVTGASNAVNLTDGLDGLATGVAIFPTAAFATLAYISGHRIFTEYLNLPYIPDIGELTIFCGAMVGACLGFLWYNAHPAQIFMGDTGSLAIGGALGTLAVLTKNELLLVIIGGVFVAEALSVMIQVSYFKWTKKRLGEGKRVFLMAPLHHHFEKLGWEETKVVVRFWIVAAMLALIALTTIKLR
ncbi:MAG: phospho-N-acetylmuramoyl-pentapeptide-transferase [Gemmatimonadetes bacterium]|nr:MAG: phospho-N-acetylmuramoyl-pentapeptide-transferase [Gemmatimonadota bacterium]